MSFNKSLFVIVLAILLAACSGRIYTVVNPSLDGKDRMLNGVITYQPVNVIELYKTTLLVEESSNKVIGSSADKKCIEEKKVKFSIRADYNKPQLVGYAPGFLDKNKFGITLKDGLVLSVNSESDPTSSLQDLAAVLPFVKAPFAEKKAMIPPDGGGNLPLCNAGDKFIGLFLAPDIQPFNELLK